MVKTLDGLQRRNSVVLPQDFRFVDPHHHLWDLKQPGYRWLKSHRDMSRYLGDYSAICKDYSVDQFKSDGAGVRLHKSVHIETADLEDPVGETEWLQRVADSNAEGFPHGIVGAADLAARNAGEMLDRHMVFRNFRGVRMLTFRDESFIYDSSFREGLRQLARRGLLFDMDAEWSLMKLFGDLADEIGDLQFVLGHCGFPKHRTPEYFKYWRSGINNLARRPNVACKISGLGMIDHNWTPDTIRPWVEACLEEFGPDRCMFATNWPVDSLFGSYGDLIAAYFGIVRGLGETECQQLFAENAERIYRI